MMVDLIISVKVLVAVYYLLGLYSVFFELMQVITISCYCYFISVSAMKHGSFTIFYHCAWPGLVAQGLLS